MTIWILESIVILLLGLGAVAFSTLLERKSLGLSQLRLGPNKASMSGLLQPIFDGIKLLWKELFYIAPSQSMFYMGGPAILMLLFILVWVWVLPWRWGGPSISKYSSLLYFSLLGLGAYSVILTGWSSTSSFSKLGSLRAMLQSLSFEVALIFAFLVILSSFKSLNMNVEEGLELETLILWLGIWLSMTLMETNRAPFDLMEGESELISGFNIEMGSILFVYLFLSEYGMIIAMALIASMPQFGEVNVFSMFFVVILLFTRSCFPRMRYDIMMGLMWQAFLPVVVFFFAIVLGGF